MLSSSPSASAAATKDRPLMRVLVGEPQTASAPINLRALHGGRLEARLAHTTAHIFEQLEAWRPHLYVISDEFGAPIVALIGQLRGRTNAPILLLNSSENAAHTARSLVAGADAVVTRPISDDVLLATTQAMIRRVYQYSVPTVAAPAAPSNGGARPLAPRTNAPGASARPASYHMWPRCEECGYLGPRDRFEQRDSKGNFSIVCPTCGNNNIRLPIG